MAIGRGENPLVALPRATVSQIGQYEIVSLIGSMFGFHFAQLANYGLLPGRKKKM